MRWVSWLKGFWCGLAHPDCVLLAEERLRGITRWRHACEGAQGQVRMLHAELTHVKRDRDDLIAEVRKWAAERQKLEDQVVQLDAKIETLLRERDLGRAIRESIAQSGPKAAPKPPPGPPNRLVSEDGSIRDKPTFNPDGRRIGFESPPACDSHIDCARPPNWTVCDWTVCDWAVRDWAVRLALGSSPPVCDAHVDCERPPNHGGDCGPGHWDIKASRPCDCTYTELCHEHRLRPAQMSLGKEWTRILDTAFRTRVRQTIADNLELLKDLE